ncbi:MAG: ethanolamine utilization protein EutH [Eubacterium sp.]|nr:ethanolamine utilization protein EutH [Eubacterium sp.]
MNIITAVLLILCLAGFADSMTGYHLKIGIGFDDAFRQFGSLVMSVCGFYCMSTVFVTGYMELFEQIGKILPFHISILSSMILETTMGGYPIAQALAGAEEVRFFSGILVSCGLGCLISFQMPVALSMIRREEINIMMRGMIPGILMIPTGLLAGGFLAGMQPSALAINMIPIIFLCGLLVLGVSRFPRRTQKIMVWVGLILKVIAQTLTVLVIVNFFIPSLDLVPWEMAYEGILVCLKITVSVAGGMVVFAFVNAYLGKQTEKLAGKLGMNSYSVLGLLLSVFSPVIMLPIFHKMDKKGKIANAAFSVMGSYVFGGQMSFVSQVTTGHQFMSYIIAKLTAGIFAVVLGLWMTRKKII